ncbi:hypothetical protein [Streptomyces cathayae]|uniref:YiaAB two helix domain-containing protein n=1 Tax=Streptomyces cathayae TaxID=3031124 RepID=A0ABY8K037_9ACTN|nr:hypothetical protein [Streptomyces sp. HUAS 5]WGD40165.1 hypothetical protein PYS65_08490 [Streptomyces sp. HUAS 5]
MADHRTFQAAVRVEKARIWSAWASGGSVMLAAALATQDIRVVGVVTQVLLVGGGIAFTVTAVRMTDRLNRKAETARRDALGSL